MSYCSEDKAFVSQYGLLYACRDHIWWRREYPVSPDDYWERMELPPPSRRRLLPQAEVDEILAKFPLPETEVRFGQGKRVDKPR